jgi:hypothetical protein
MVAPAEGPRGTQHRTLRQTEICGFGPTRLLCRMKQTSSHLAIMRTHVALRVSFYG